jgi:hypothetical protein
MATALRLVAFLVALVSLTGCPGTSFWKPRLDRIHVGMTREEVIDVLGKPGEVSASGGAEYLKYGWDDPVDGRVGAARWYFVRLVNGKVDAYGRVGDFDSTKTHIEIDQTIRHAE